MIPKKYTKLNVIVYNCAIGQKSPELAVFTLNSSWIAASNRNPNEADGVEIFDVLKLCDLYASTWNEIVGNDLSLDLMWFHAKMQGYWLLVATEWHQNGYYRLIDWLTDWLTDCLTQWRLNDWMAQLATNPVTNCSNIWLLVNHTTATYMTIHLISMSRQVNLDEAWTQQQQIAVLT